MDERYVRNLGALTEQECTLLGTKTVFVAGCGGLGGYLIEMLLRLGIGTIRAADGDVFEVSNLNRQLLSSPSSLGQSKAEAAASRAALVNPDVRFEAIPEFVTGDPGICNGGKRQPADPGLRRRSGRAGQYPGAPDSRPRMRGGGYSPDPRGDLRLERTGGRRHAGGRSH